MATARSNVTNKAQTDLEIATFENGAPVFANDKTRVLVGGNQGGSENVSHAAGSRNSNAGVIRPASDAQNRFEEATIGRA